MFSESSPALVVQKMVFPLLFLCKCAKKSVLAPNSDKHFVALTAPLHMPVSYLSSQQKLQKLELLVSPVRCCKAAIWLCAVLFTLGTLYLKQSCTELSFLICFLWFLELYCISL